MLNEDSRLRGAVPRIEVRRAAGAVFSRMRGALFASASSIENGTAFSRMRRGLVRVLPRRRAFGFARMRGGFRCIKMGRVRQGIGVWRSW